MAAQQRNKSLLKALLLDTEAKTKTLGAEIEGLNVVLRQLELAGASPSEREAVEKQLAKLRDEMARRLREIDELEGDIEEWV